MNCFNAVSRDQNRGSVKRPPWGSRKDQHMVFSELPREGFLSSLEKSHRSSWNLDTSETCGLSPLQPTSRWTVGPPLKARVDSGFMPGFPSPPGAVFVPDHSSSPQRP